jgi:hypothetical protein
VLFADQQNGFRGELGATVHRAHRWHRPDRPCAGKAARAEIAGEQVGRRHALEDPGDLLRDEGGPAVLVVDAGESQDDGRDVAALRCNQCFGVGLRLRIGPRRIERRVLVDALRLCPDSAHAPASCWRTRTARCRPLQRCQQPTRALHGHLFVSRVFLARRVVIGGEMDDRCDRTEAFAATSFTAASTLASEVRSISTVSMSPTGCLAFRRSSPMTR